MYAATANLLEGARRDRYAVGAFNVYNLEGALAVVGAAVAERSPAILQIHPRALDHGGMPLVALCLAATQAADVPIGIHLDHSTRPAEIEAALAAGIASVMADGSHLPYAQNLAFTREMAVVAHRRGAFVEAELGRLAGTEDNLTVAEYEARLTEPGEAATFVAETGVNGLAICIGNVHGHYHGAAQLDFDRLAAIRAAVPVPLVLHGASGLPESLVHRAIALGITKLNVNTELRDAYLLALHTRVEGELKSELVDLMQNAVEAMQAVVATKLHLFGSSGRSPASEQWSADPQASSP